MKNLKSFHTKLVKENTNDYFVEESVDKDIAKEDSLELVSQFVKDVKKKFPNKQDKLEILRDVSKVLEFYINEIENTSSSIDVMSASSAPPVLGFDDVQNKGEDDDIDTVDNMSGISSLLKSRS